MSKRRASMTDMARTAADGCSGIALPTATHPTPHPERVLRRDDAPDTLSPPGRLAAGA